MKINYVGIKEGGETAFSQETSITWLPGDTFEVSDAVAQKMLRHPDVFALADEPVSLADAKQPVKPDALVAALPLEARQVKLPDGEVLSLQGLDADALRALADAHGVKVHHKAGADKIADALVAALPLED